MLKTVRLWAYVMAAVVFPRAREAADPRTPPPMRHPTETASSPTADLHQPGLRNRAVQQPAAHAEPGRGEDVALANPQRCQLWNRPRATQYVAARGRQSAGGGRRLQSRVDGWRPSLLRGRRDKRHGQGLVGVGEAGGHEPVLQPIRCAWPWTKPSSWVRQMPLRPPSHGRAKCVRLTRNENRLAVEIRHAPRRAPSALMTRSWSERGPATKPSGRAPPLGQWTRPPPHGTGHGAISPVA